MSEDQKLTGLKALLAITYQPQTLILAGTKKVKLYLDDEHVVETYHEPFNPHYRQVTYHRMSTPIMYEL